MLSEGWSSRAYIKYVISELVNRHSVNGSYNYSDFPDVTDFSPQVNPKFTGGLDNALHAETAIGLSIQWTVSKYQLNV